MVATNDVADWDKLEDNYIKAPTGETKTNHIFLVDINRNNGNSMYLQESDGSNETELHLVKPQYHTTRILTSGEVYSHNWCHQLAYKTSSGENYTRSGEHLCHKRRSNSGDTIKRHHQRTR